ncbi:Response regulator receiver domain-containing protein [Bryocella elongata]|uniref:Response regulator receiver domain-containing protein n=1 Tax=Bryocella elongata TaxID=863522 RepID=A0A1H5W658_9BACT|nr:response regulator [Bryocella elongata]SEF94972.1 Response regulator receiver domain-containing protein [Bryocella elongata]
MKQRVLIVDDDRLVADTLSLVFRLNGFDSEARYSAADGLNLARSFAPTLLLTDVTMPGESGLDLADAVAREMPDCKLMMLTAYESNTPHVEKHTARTRRPIRMLYKPVRPEELIREVHELLLA